MDYCSGDAWERECTQGDRQQFNKLYEELFPEEVEKQVNCEVCNKSFRDKNSYDQHVKNSLLHKFKLLKAQRNEHEGLVVKPKKMKIVLKYKNGNKIVKI